MNNNFKNNDAANISIALTERAEELLEALGIDGHEGPNYWHFACPIHGGSSETGCTLYCDEGTQGNLNCWSQLCHESIVNTTLGFLRAVLSTQSDQPVSFGDTLRWAKNFLGGKIPDYVGGQDLRQKRIDANLARVGAVPTLKNRPSIKAVCDRLVIPSPYFLSRGYSEGILSQFYVGEPRLSPNPDSPLYNRAIVPILDRDGVSVMGYTARAITDGMAPKWHHQDVETSQILYGYYEAQKAIAEREEVILVEGPGDVWRMREAGVENVVGMFGASLKDAQQIILETSGCLNILMASDSDEAGEKGFASLLTKLGYLFNIKRKRPVSKDWGCESLETIKRIFLK